MLTYKCFIVIQVYLQSTSVLTFPIVKKELLFPLHKYSVGWGPAKILNLSGASRFVIFIDDSTQGLSIFLLKQKSDVGQVFKSFIQMIKNQFGSTIKRVHLDSAKDCFKQTLSSFFNEGEVIHESSYATTHNKMEWQNEKFGNS